MELSPVTFRTASALLALLVLGACDSDDMAPPPAHKMPFYKVTADGDEAEVDTAVAIDTHCLVKAPVAIQVVAPPANGAVDIRSGPDRQLFPANDPHAKCSGKEIVTNQVWYKPEPGFRGTDSFSVEARFPNGEIRNKTYPILVE
jgi:hypothetical protein